MKITLVVVCFILLTIPYKITGDDSEENGKISRRNIGDVLSSITALDMNGDLKRKFALEAALAAPEQNMVCSPLSALLPLGKLSLGASGKALRELYAALGVTEKRQIKAAFDRTIHRLKNFPGVTLDLASCLYVSTQSMLKKPFVHEALEIFESSCEKADFSNPKKSAATINSWVAKQTNNIFSNIISPSDISGETSVIIVNAIYFKGNWKHPFRNVKTGTFMSARGQRTVLMMHQKGSFNYYMSNLLNAQIIQLPYINEHASFVIVLPYQNNGLKRLLEELNVVPQMLNSEMAKMRKASVNLTMPKFKVQTDLDLKVLYKKIGVRAIFEDSKALPDIVYGPSLTVTNSIQNSIIEVSESGTEAAAVSVGRLCSAGCGWLAVLSHLRACHSLVYPWLLRYNYSVATIYPTSLEERKNVYIDHPFLFIVKMKQQQLFMGILNDP